ncbi:MAG: hypothetical protein JNJ54_15070 [Myxococcaceae bacterium]|nr:hypothetical protein [Myxococcaceae bacterium]
MSRPVRLVPGDVFARFASPTCRGSLSRDGNRFVVGDDSGQLTTWERGANGRFALRARIVVPPAGAHSRPAVRNTACAPAGDVIASEEYVWVRLRRFDDLSVLSERLCGGAQRVLDLGAPGFLVAGNWMLKTPDLKEGALHSGEVCGAAVLPWSNQVVTTVERPSEETAMAMRTWQGTAPVQLVDLATGRPVRTLLDDTVLAALAVDEARRRVLFATYGDAPIAVYDESGAQLPSLGQRSGRTELLLVRDDWILSVPNAVGREVSVDCWDAASLEPLGKASLQRQFSPPWIAASARTLVIPDLPAGEPGARFAVREWSIDR